ncbi:MAG: TatD family nuclease-associated radical SAM protein, partial [Candidatus Omnitrophica bacterium]|nr:TatD family nuclease-associated radical SAM protein [Candidatus Omnitrophota bacterium]
RDNSWGNPERSERVGNPAKYREVVFCGYGEPLIRLDVVLKTAKILKEKGVYIRINTNGHGNLIHGRSIVGDLIGLIDEVSVSLDTDTADKYNSICQPKFGSRTYEKIKEFIAECKKALPKVGITCIDLREVDMDHCRKIAQELGVGFRARHYNEVG